MHLEDSDLEPIICSLGDELKLQGSFAHVELKCTSSPVSEAKESTEPTSPIKDVYLSVISLPYKKGLTSHTNKTTL